MVRAQILLGPIHLLSRLSMHLLLLAKAVHSVQGLMMVVVIAPLVPALSLVILLQARSIHPQVLPTLRAVRLILRAVRLTVRAVLLILRAVLPTPRAVLPILQAVRLTVRAVRLTHRAVLLILQAVRLTLRQVRLTLLQAQHTLRAALLTPQPALLTLQPALLTLRAVLLTLQVAQDTVQVVLPTRQAVLLTVLRARPSTALSRLLRIRPNKRLNEASKKARIGSRSLSAQSYHSVNHLALSCLAQG